MLRADTTRFVEDQFIMTEEAQNAALFTTGNGYIGVRGSFEEYGSLRIQGAYIRGIMDEVVEVFEPFAENEYMKKYYIDEEKLTAQQIAEKENVEARTVYKDITNAVKPLSALIFGIDSLKLD